MAPNQIIRASNGLSKNQLIKLFLSTFSEPLYVLKVDLQILQPYTPKFTPSRNFNAYFINDLKGWLKRDTETKIETEKTCFNLEELQSYEIVNY